MIFKNKDVKVIILEIFLITLGLVGLTLGVKYIMNSINVNVDTSKLAIDSMNANVTNGTLMPINDSTVNINTTSNVLRITFDVKGASTNTGSNIIYDVLLNLTADCSLKNESVKWNLYKNNNLLTSGSTSPKYDKDVLKGKIMLTDIQQDLVPYSKTADKYVFILWMSESCNEEDITKCDLSNALTSDSGGKSISGNIDIRLNSGKKKENKRVSIDSNGCTAAEYIMKLDDGTTGDEGAGVYKVEHSAISAESSATGSEIPAVNDYRYYGANPNNYICLGTVNNGSCESERLYRIIGSIYEELEHTNRLKIIKATALTDGTTRMFSWDNSEKTSKNCLWSPPTKDKYSNSLTNGSSIMQLLNSGAWWNSTSGSYNNDTTSVNFDFTNYGLNDSIKRLIDKSRYYLGSFPFGNGADAVDFYTETFYLGERGTVQQTIYDSDEYDALYWDGYIGLFYPSDFGYAMGKKCVVSSVLVESDEECNAKSWLGRSGYSMISLQHNPFYSSGFIRNLICYGTDPYERQCYSTRTISPVFYLTSSTIITSGTGTIDDPYILASE